MGEKIQQTAIDLHIIPIHHVRIRVRLVSECALRTHSSDDINGHRNQFQVWDFNSFGNRRTRAGTS